MKVDDDPANQGGEIVTFNVVEKIFQGIVNEAGATVIAFTDDRVLTTKTNPEGRFEFADWTGAIKYP